jgi:pimeloyl-ACP methyl ester carboxylesterase
MGFASSGGVFADAESASRTASVNGIELHYEIAGEGDPLVLLHSGTQTTRMWDPFVGAFAEDYRVIAVDLRGHGGSTNPDDLWTTRQFAHDVYALLDSLGVERFKGVGASAGAMTLLHMATQQPERVEAMVVVGVGTYLPVECRQTLAATDSSAIPDNVMAFYRSQHAHGDDQIRALFDWVASLATSYNDMTFSPACLATITARTLVVHGDRDYCFPASMAWDIYDAIPDAFLWVVPNGGHVPIQGPYAPAFTKTVVEFLSGSWQQTQPR